MRTKDEWRNILEAKLPPKARYIARNRAITAYYAQWYLQKPHLLKWAGMASFASHQVGIGLAVAEMLAAPNTMITTVRLPKQSNLLDLGARIYGLAFNLVFSIPVALHNAATRELMLNDLDLIKYGNDAIFDDIGWAHLAYIEDGITAIEANVSESERECMLRGFQMIDAGAKKLDDPAERAAGQELIRTGNILLLKHEQMNILPSVFGSLTSNGKVGVSLGSVLDFGENGSNGRLSIASFNNYFGSFAILSGQRCLTKFEDRWEWLEHDLLPLWDELEAAYVENCPLHRRLVAMANQEPTTLQQVTTLMNAVYPLVGLKVDLAALTSP